MNNFYICIAETENDFIDFEKGTFEAFSKRNPNNWLCRNYILIDDNRYQSPIPYPNQIIFLAKENNNVIAGASLNKNMKIKLQAEEIGFKIPEKFKTVEYCEALLLFTLRNTEINPFLIGLKLRDTFRNDLKKQGFNFIIGTCSENLKEFYKKFGFYLIDEKINEDGEKKYLLMMDL